MKGTRASSTPCAPKTAWRPLFPRPRADIIDATDTDDDGGALELLRRGVKIANGEREDNTDGEKDEFSALPNAVAVRRLAQLVARVPQDLAADERRVQQTKDAAAFVLSCHKAADGRNDHDH